MRLSDIEKKIIDIHREINGLPEKLKRPMTLDRLNAEIEKAKIPLKQELEILEKKRQFILDKRNNWKSKILWSVITPIVVAFVTAYLVSKLV